MMKKRSCISRLSCLVYLGVLSVLWNCSPAMDSQAPHEPEPTEAAMTPAHEIETPSPSIPPIDMSAPAVFESASFGLG